MSNHWRTFEVTPDEGNVNKSIPGGRFLDVGTHEVTIQAVEGHETRTGIPYVRVVYENGSGQSIKDSLFLTYEKDGVVKHTVKYNRLAHAVAENASLRFKFFKGFLPRVPDAFPALVGMKVGIEISKGRKGYTIEDAGGVYKLMDVASGSFLELDNGVLNEFESYRDAREAADANTVGGNKIYRAWNEVTNFSVVESEVKANEEALAAILSDAEAEGSL